MSTSAILGAQRSGRIFEFIERARLVLLGCLFAGVLAGLTGLLGLRIDRSFTPVFRVDHTELDKTRRFESVFGKAGFNELVAIVDVGNAADVDALMPVGELADYLKRLSGVVEVRDPRSLPYVDCCGIFHPAGVGGDSLPLAPNTIGARW
jgi:predicted RND superfamily exporter protein